MLRITTVRRASLAGIFLLGVVVVAGITVFLMSLFAPRWDGGIVIDRIVPITEMATAQGTVFAYLTNEDVGLKQATAPRLFGKQFLIVEKAQVKMGFKLTDWDPKIHVRHNPMTQTVTIALPPPEILSVEPLPRTKKIMTQAGLLGDQDLTKEEVREIDIKLDELFRKSDSALEMREQARQKIQALVADILAPYKLKASVVYQ